jgi:hypothetical protein
MNAFPLVLAVLVAAGLAPGARAQSADAPEPIATAGPADTVAKPVRAKSDEDPNERICKYVVQTGSRMGNKKCHTRAYWADMELAARNKMREIDSQPIPVKAN